MTGDERTADAPVLPEVDWTELEAGAEAEEAPPARNTDAIYIEEILRLTEERNRRTRMGYGWRW
ncbi:MAG: hypothetical protein IJK28_05570 [Clostridia bacterium]|nr:hypothetical protein [Lachnospiraceae bacterium]MBQ6174073.1 hypothetical protein [Clostridia bacterium]